MLRERAEGEVKKQVERKLPPTMTNQTIGDSRIRQAELRWLGDESMSIQKKGSSDTLLYCTPTRRRNREW